MSIRIREVGRDEAGEVVPLLLLAEPSWPALRWSLKNLSDTVYRMDDAESRAVAAATVRWNREPCEIVEMAVAADQQGRGLGRQMVEWIVGEARRRGKSRLVVGTSSVSAGNILFYQKCGFRPEEIRRDYFWYYDKPVVENGLPARDMIVFSRDLTGEEAGASPLPDCAIRP